MSDFITGNLFSDRSVSNIAYVSLALTGPSVKKTYYFLSIHLKRLRGLLKVIVSDLRNTITAGVGQRLSNGSILSGKLTHNLFTSLLIGTCAVNAQEPDGAFGVKFGQPVPQELVTTTTGKAKRYVYFKPKPGYEGLGGYAAIGGGDGLVACVLAQAGFASKLSAEDFCKTLTDKLADKYGQPATIELIRKSYTFGTGNRIVTVEMSPSQTVLGYWSVNVAYTDRVLLAKVNEAERKERSSAVNGDGL